MMNMASNLFLASSRRRSAPRPSAVGTRQDRSRWKYRKVRLFHCARPAQHCACEKALSDAVIRLHPRLYDVKSAPAQQPAESSSASIALAQKDNAWFFTATAIVHGAQGKLGCPLQSYPCFVTSDSKKARFRTRRIQPAGNTGAGWIRCATRKAFRRVRYSRGW